jgi:hypothetical protein
VNYLIAGSPPRLEVPPANSTAYAISPDTEYLVRVDTETSGSAFNAGLWLIEYDGSSRVSSAAFNLRGGPEEFAFRTGPHTKSFRILLRCADGPGTLTVESLEIRRPPR